MDFSFNAEDEAFREEIRTWVRANLPADIAARSKHQFHLPASDTARWVALLNADGKGWAVPNWTVEQGGPGWTLMQQYIFEEVLIEEDAPVIDVGGAKMFGPIINKFGTTDQIERFIKRHDRWLLRSGRFHQSGEGQPCNQGAPPEHG